MTELYRADVELPAASLGSENPLPPLVSPQPVQQVANPDELPADLRAGLEYGRLDSVLPCLRQDGYDRELRPRTLPALALENDLLRAVVLPSLGGRLYSLVDKRTGRELLFRNPVFQPANLALRDAWFAGGVEWNLGSTGHTTLTCSPMHAAAVTGPDGSPVLRIWEWERTRNLPYLVDFWLPEGSPVLLVGVRVRNPHDEDVPAYWWSNIAVPQSADTRVLVPAEKAWHYGYRGTLDLVPVTPDLTSPMRHEHAADFFFEMSVRRPWIAAVGGDGYGLAQASTARLRGRKLFVWGTRRGGRRWQSWLAPGVAGDGYLEIQAGLARTQLEHLRLPPGQSWDWLEAYGPVSGISDPAGVETQIADPEVLESRLDQWRTVADREPGEMLHTGSGWGALEVRRAGFDLPGTPFGEPGEPQRPWLDLLSGEDLRGEPGTPPGCTLVAPAWRRLLEDAEDNWLVWYHRGVARWYTGDRAGASAAWLASDAASANPWARRNLAVMATMDGRPEEAAELLASALALRPDEPALAVEAVEAAGPRGVLDLVSELPERVRGLGRIRLLEARALLATGDPAGALAVFDEGFEIADLREGETSLSDTWQEIQWSLGSETPLPERYDFRMS
ncbi:DUF5107 domain-containing protein [Amycolatopsis suaedae]|uniref:DUF5107 domain-containing protein n=1 Tax=Amycolatopsis suaedae TaxID=2510978 RepID=A0A4Q7J6U5_9PSEU|nr:DUF5107 domain-containing protein [Amycolatopsis suaedae]RZQ61734.1 DUF5107 domain-containing protein [Amycolatopsis suaedae]